MEIKAFYDKVLMSEQLECVKVAEGETPADDHFIIKNKKTGAKYKVAVAAVVENDWQQLDAVLSGAREPRILRHMTRIVGYYSQVENWNKSKVGELRDRQAGVYAVKGESPEPSPVKSEKVSA